MRATTDQFQVAHVVRDRALQSPEAFVPHHHTVPPTVHLLEAIVDKHGERISNCDQGEVQPKRVAKEIEMKHPLTDKEILGNLELFDAHLQHIDKEVAKTSHTGTLAENVTKSLSEDVPRVEGNNNNLLNHPIESELMNVKLDNCFNFGQQQQWSMRKRATLTKLI